MHLDQKHVEPVVDETVEVCTTSEPAERVPVVQVRVPHLSCLAHLRRATDRVRSRGLSRKNRHRQ